MTIIITLPTFDMKFNRIIIIASDSQETETLRNGEGKIIHKIPTRRVRKIFYVRTKNGRILVIVFTGIEPKGVKFADHMRNFDRGLTGDNSRVMIIEQLQHYFENLELEPTEKLDVKILFTWVDGDNAVMSEIWWKDGQWKYHFLNKKNVYYGSKPEYSIKFKNTLKLTPMILQIIKNPMQTEAEAICDQFITYVSSQDEESGMGTQMAVVSEKEFKWIRKPATKESV